MPSCLALIKMITVSALQFLNIIMRYLESCPSKMENKKGKKFDEMIQIIFPIDTMLMGVIGIIVPFFYLQDIFNALKIWNGLLSLHLQQSHIYVLGALTVLCFFVIMTFTRIKWEAFMLCQFILLNTLHSVPRELVEKLGEINEKSVTSLGEVESFYRQLYLTTSLFNLAHKTLLIFAKFNLIFVATLGFANVVNNGLSLISIFLATSSSGFVFLVLFIFYEGGEIYEITSKPFQAAWRGAAMKRPSTFVTEMRIGNSLRPSRIESGAQYFMDRGVPFKILDAILNNVITILVCFS